MGGTRPNSRKLTNFNILLLDVRICLGEDYVYYEECVVAIATAAARKEDASAWYEQLERVVDGITPLAISHSGVLFLLGRRGEAPLTNMPPPPLPQRKSPATMDKVTPSPAPSANVAELDAKHAPAVGLKNPEEDLFLFNDPAFRSEVEDFFGIKASANVIPDHHRARQPSFNTDASYYNAYNFLSSYKPADDDLQIFRERAATTPTVQNNVLTDERDRAKRDTEWQQMMQQVNAEAAGL
ncbi:hypothetical protein CC86DRAFT_278145 [Ophiobolus disseminans]|uniref:PH domain-containing protein n=1 Tax=Ophiobolus disseminans TaxID=1469910 RepID=A0A6A7AKI1_9PLEO|nr:hypothetical protein CC86DRAFT_278145 [Ophiobolus disseminans]